MNSQDRQTQMQLRMRSGSPADSFLAGFLETRGFAEPTGKPLYRYNTEAHEVSELQAILADEMRGRHIDRPVAMAFCLWASEWWRRNYAGGPWKWDILLRVIDQPDFAPGRGRYRELQDLVARGFRGWRRQVVRVGYSRGYLATIACEGGLPLQLVLKQHAHLRSYLRGVLEEFRLFAGSGVPPFELAERVRDRLPKSLQQHVVYELSADLINEVRRLQALLGDTATPVRDLDGLRPGWRDELPVRVTDEVARVLLNGLLLDAAEVARGGKAKVRWIVHLRPSAEGEWLLEGGFDLPVSLAASEFNQLFARPTDASLPRRFELAVRTAGSPDRRLAILTRRRSTSGEVFFGLELLSGARERVTATPGCPRELVVRTAEETLTTDLFPGAGGLNELPWVFAPEEPEALEPTPARLVGQGSIKVREPWVLVALPVEHSREVPGDAEARPVGRLVGCGRDLLVVRGRVRFHAADGSGVTIETSSTEVLSGTDYRLRGPVKLLGRSEQPVFVAPPTLQEWRDGAFVSTIPSHDLEWKPDGPGARWGPYDAQVVGAGRLRYIAHGDVLHTTRIQIIPREARIEIRPSTDPQAGEIVFIGFHGARIAVANHDGIHAVVEEEARECRVRCVARGRLPHEVGVACDWGPRGRLELRLPFPATSAEFCDATGRRLPSESSVALSTLSGMRAETVAASQARFEVQGHCTRVAGSSATGRAGFFKRELIDKGGGYHALDLTDIQPIIADLVESGTDLDAEVRLHLHSNEASLPRRRLHVRRFDLRLEVKDRGVPLVGLEEASLLQVAPKDIGELVLEALPLLQPDQEPIPLERQGSVTWRIPEDRMEHGPHLLLGRQQDWHRVRPMRWFVIDSVAGLHEKSRRPTTLAELYSGGFSGEGDLVPFLSVARQMARDPDHEDWPVAFSYLRLTSLPPQTFALLRAVARRPETTALAAVRASAADFELGWERLELVGLRWWQFPLTVWEDAISSYFETNRRHLEVLEDAALRSELLAQELGPRIQRLGERLHGLEPALLLLKARLLEEPVPRGVDLITEESARAALERSYADHRNGCPSLGMAPGVVPDLSPLQAFVRRAKAKWPWSEPLFVTRAGRFGQPERADYADAPSVMAAAVMQGVSLEKRFADQIAEVRRMQPEWFDDALHTAQLLAFANKKALESQEHVHG